MQVRTFAAKKGKANVQTCFIDPVDDPCVDGGGTGRSCPPVVGRCPRTFCRLQSVFDRRTLSCRYGRGASDAGKVVREPGRFVRTECLQPQ